MKNLDYLEYLVENIKVDTFEKDEIIDKLEKIKNKKFLSKEDIGLLKSIEENQNKKYSQQVQLIAREIIEESGLERKEIESIKPVGKIPLKKEPEIKIEISPDKMTGFITVIPDNIEIDRQFLVDKLKEKGIIKGIIDENIDKILEKYKRGERVERFIIARGQKPVDGRDGKIEVKFKKDEKLTEEYKKENSITDREVVCGMVKQGDVLVKKIPATSGFKGYTVTGEELIPKKGKEVNLQIKRNVVYHSESNTYRALVDGIAVLEDNTLFVKQYIPGSFKVKISSDEMEVYLTVFPSAGGAPAVTLKKVLEFLETVPVKVEIDRDAIEQAIKNAEENHKPVYNVKIAEGEYPVNGEDGKIEYKIHIATGKCKILEDGRIDFKEKDLITQVKENQLIGILYLPTPGKKDGITVTGKKIPAQPGKSVKLIPGKNIKFVEKNRIIEIYSEINGHLKLEDDTIYVNPFFIVKGNVDFNTGHINFSGDVIINGDVLDEFKVIADGDIIIKGSVGASYVKSGGTIIVKNGIHGKGKGTVEAKKTIFTKFIENATVKAGENLIVGSAVIQSRLFVENELQVTGDRGQITGGIVYAGKIIKARNIGSPAGVKTEIYIGFDYRKTDELEKVLDKKNEYIKNLETLNNVIKKIKKYKAKLEKESKLREIYIKALEKKEIILNQLHIIKEEEKKIREAQIKYYRPEMYVYGTLYTDVKINYAGKVIEIKDPHYRVKLARIEGRNTVGFMKL